MTDAVIVKTRKFKRNPLLARKQVCTGRRIWMCNRKPVQCKDDDNVSDGTVETNSVESYSFVAMESAIVKNALNG